MQLNQFRYPREVRAADADGAGVLSCQTLVKVRYPFAVAEHVITSYSIHYTKLYEAPAGT